MSTFYIRKVEEKDRSSWLAFRIEVYEDDDEAAHALEMSLYEGALDRECFVAVDTKDQVVGILEMSLRNIVDGCVTSPVGYIEGIFVKAGDRGKGLGRRLTQTAKEWAMQKGCKELGTDALITNEKAQRFHETMGFEEVDRIVGYRMRLTNV